MILSPSRPTAKLQETEGDVSVGQPAHTELREFVGSALRHELGVSRPSIPRNSDSPTVEVLTLHRVEGLAFKYAPVLGLPADVLSVLSARAMGQSMAGLNLGRKTVIVASLFRDFGVDFLVFKGVALSALTGRDIAQRGSGDIDILVASGDVPRIHRELLKRGFTPKVSFAPQEGPMWKFWSFRERELSYLRGDIFIDLHWRIGKDPRHLPPTRRTLGRATTFALGSDHLPTLTPGDALAAAAQHLYLDYCQNMRLIVDMIHVSHIEGVSLQADLPESGRQLVSDVLEFSRTLLGADLVPQVPGTLPPKPRHVDYLVSLWNQNSSGSLLAAGPSSGGGEALGRLGHWLRYSPRLSTLARFLSWAICAFPTYRESTPHTGFLKSMLYRAQTITTGQLPYLVERELARQGDHA